MTIAFVRGLGVSPHFFSLSASSGWSPFRDLGSIACDVEFDDHGLVHDTVDRRSSGHRILEDLVPLREHEVAGDHHAATLLAVRQEREQHLLLVTVLPHVADVVQGHTLIALPSRVAARCPS